MADTAVVFDPDHARRIARAVRIVEGTYSGKPPPVPPPAPRTSPTEIVNITSATLTSGTQPGNVQIWRPDLGSYDTGPACRVLNAASGALATGRYLAKFAGLDPSFHQAVYVVGGGAGSNDSQGFFAVITNPGTAHTDGGYRIYYAWSRLELDTSANNRFKLATSAPAGFDLSGDYSNNPALDLGNSTRAPTNAVVRMWKAGTGSSLGRIYWFCYSPPQEAQVFPVRVTSGPTYSAGHPTLAVYQGHILQLPGDTDTNGFPFDTSQPDLMYGEGLSNFATPCCEIGNNTAVTLNKTYWGTWSMRAFGTNQQYPALRNDTTLWTATPVIWFCAP